MSSSDHSEKVENESSWKQQILSVGFAIFRAKIVTLIEKGGKSCFIIRQQIVIDFVENYSTETVNIVCISIIWSDSIISEAKLHNLLNYF